MIQANELRIGNCINYKGEPIVVTLIGDRGIQSDNPERTINAKFSTTDLTPIPLTPDILEKCGFIKHNNSNEYWTFWKLPNEWHIGQSHHTEPSAGVETGKYYWGESYTEVKNLHHLQNLYFALTGEELKINL